MNLEQIVDHFNTDNEMCENFVLKKDIPEKTPQFSNIPAKVDPKLVNFLNNEGIKQLYTHQAQAFNQYQAGNNFVLTTPTASGKTLSYLLPIMQDKLDFQPGRHLFLFPTKALAQDQLALFRKWNNYLDTKWQISTFDGDTPIEERRNAKKAGDLILTNPDMLHSGILPHHNTWRLFFENLRTIVIDEMHTYLGVFGSHVSNVLRRLNRILEIYGAKPKYIFCSATIANPQELAQNLAGQEFELIDQSGAPEGQKHFYFYNPPIIDQDKNRQSAYRAAAKIGTLLMTNNIPTIFFARSRIRVELLVTLIRNMLPWHLKSKIKGYRGGYLPLERRKLEKDLRQGNLMGIVSTNALELGIDIGMLSAVVSVGYPGRISSLLQQFGRAGRKKEPALAVMVATMGALDQYLMHNPDYIFDSKGEAAIVNPNNMMIALEHIKCAAFEANFNENEYLGDLAVDDYLQFLEQEQVLVKRNHAYYWAEQTYPAGDISLRSGARDNFVIVDKTKIGSEKVIGQVDYFSAPLLIHEEAIYIHQGKHFFVEKLDWEKRQADVSLIRNDYYTDAHANIEVAVISKDEEKEYLHNKISYGDVKVVSKAALFKKIKIDTNENLGWGEITTPEISMHTQAGWIEFQNKTVEFIPNWCANSLLQRLAYAFKNLAPLIALCDIRDLEVLGFYKDTQFENMTLIFYDQFPGGVGLSFKLMDNLDALYQLTLENIKKCECEKGCPSCIGVFDIQYELKNSLKGLNITESNSIIEKMFEYNYKDTIEKLLTLLLH